MVVAVEDEFGVSNFLHASTNGGGECTEVYASVGETMLVRDVPVRNLLRPKTKTKDESYQMLKKLTISYDEIAKILLRATTTPPWMSNYGRNY